MLDHLTWRVVFLLGTLSSALCALRFEPTSVEFGIEELKSIRLLSTTRLPYNATIRLKADHYDVVSIEPEEIHVEDEKSWTLIITGKTPGFTVISAIIDNTTGVDSAFLHVTVGKLYFLEIIGSLVGWIYFAAWSISFYPQMYENYTRKSVEGLSFDFISLNVVGFILYSVYNCALYYLPAMQNEYFDRHPKGLNPVQFNDVFFSTHAVFASTIIILQCFLYESGGQCVSTVARIILFIYHCIVIASGIAAYINVIHWLDFLYYCSYIKLSVTLIKYIPQAVMNYTRKSTQGWCIGNVLLDFTGGTFSLAQMLINGYNYNDWESIFGDPTKFGLGVFTIAFDLIFLYQHYILYRSIEYQEPIIDDTVQNVEPAPVSDEHFPSNPNA